METLGAKIARLRKQQNLTQEQLAEKLGVTAQSVSKWENEITSPDISLLPAIAKIFNITTDELLGIVTPEQEKKMSELTNKERKNLMFKILVNSSDGDKVKVNLPYNFVKTAIATGMKIESINSKLQGVDFQQIFDCVELGMLGKFVEVTSADGDTVEISVE